MSKIFSRAVLVKWIEKASDTNTAYHVNRQRLFETLVAISKLQADENKDNYAMSLATFNRLKQFLTARNDALAKNDAIGLSFTKILEELAKELDPVYVVNSDDDTHTSPAPTEAPRNPAESKADQQA